MNEPSGVLMEMLLLISFAFPKKEHGGNSRRDDHQTQQHSPGNHGLAFRQFRLMKRETMPNNTKTRMTASTMNRLRATRFS